METIEEIWKPIKGYEGLYEVSNLGRVKRRSRVVISKNNSKATLKEKILSGVIRKSVKTPIYYIQLKKNDGSFSYQSLPKLILSTFSGIEIINFEFIDGNHLNNRLSNLKPLNKFNKEEYDKYYYSFNKDIAKKRAAKWQEDNPEKVRLKNKLYQQKQRDSLTDVYIKRRLRDTYTEEEINNSSLIETKRNILKIQRLCRQLKN